MHCTEKRASSVSAERVGQGEVGGVTRRVTCTCWLLGLAVKAPWLGLGGPYSHLVGGSFLAGKAAWVLSGC